MDRPIAKRPRRRRGKLGFFPRLLILTLLAALSWQLWRLNGQVGEAEAERQQLQQEVWRRQEENAALQADIDEGGSQEKKMEIAREELGLVAPGDKVFYDVSN